jgi:hypothetical protein
MIVTAQNTSLSKDALNTREVFELRESLCGITIQVSLGRNQPESVTLTSCICDPVDAMIQSVSEPTGTDSK